MESGTITAHKPTNHLRGDTSLSFVGANHIIMEQDEQEGEEHPNGRELALAPVLSFTMSESKFDCNVDTLWFHPYLGCVNLITAYCTNPSPVYVSDCDCIKKVNSVRDNLNLSWMMWINSCAIWNGGEPTSKRCNDASNLMLRSKKIIQADGTSIDVP